MKNCKIILSPITLLVSILTYPIKNPSVNNFYSMLIELFILYPIVVILSPYLIWCELKN